MVKDIPCRTKQKIRNYNIDIMKIILAVFVVLIHAEVKIGIFTPFLKTAVPLFFITSSYFFFKKVNASDNKKNILMGFLKRNMRLYAFWFVVLLPITLYIRRWFADGVALGMIKFLQSFFFNSTFRGSWYLMALCIGISISLLLACKISSKRQILITLPIYLICCLFTNYYGIAEKYPALIDGYNAYIFIFRSLVNSFPVSFFWIAVGRWFAEQKKTLNYMKITVFISSVLLVVEHFIVSTFSLQLSNDCYIMLIPLCWSVFCLVKDLEPIYKGNGGIVCRFGNISTIVYVTHASIITVLSAVMNRLFNLEFWWVEWVIFALSLTVALVISAVIFRLERIKAFGWLKYSY